MIAGVYKFFEQFFSPKATNIFPVKRVPSSIKNLLAGGDIYPPIAVHDGFRGKLHYDYTSCIGCAMCEKVCPAKAIEMYPVVENEKKSKRIVIYLSRCTYCSECVNICPKNCLSMGKEFMLAGFDKYGPAMVVGSAERREHEVKEDSGA
ncbi:MAG TPA: 4Fe-4S binding protein [Spirochaetota bacterium]|nr:4Fe-4S binding protein [Spirochaetota bacterium]HQP47546.1 4Fe-4S binding protein [Spirochaetota bacterium]